MQWKAPKKSMVKSVARWLKMLKKRELNMRGKECPLSNFPRLYIPRVNS